MWNWCYEMLYALFLTTPTMARFIAKFRHDCNTWTRNRTSCCTLTSICCCTVSSEVIKRGSDGPEEATTTGDKNDLLTLFHIAIIVGIETANKFYFLSSEIWTCNIHLMRQWQWRCTWYVDTYVGYIYIYIHTHTHTHEEDIWRLFFFFFSFFFPFLDVGLILNFF